MTEATAFLWKGRTGPFELSIGPGVFRPSSTSMALAEALEVNPQETVLDVGCGSGVLAFVAGRLGAGRVYGCDVSEEAVEEARRNAEVLGLSQVTEFRVGDLLEPVRDVAADVVIGDVSGVPDEIAELTGWFPGGRGGGPTGSELPTAMLRDIHEVMRPGGRLYLPTGTIQAEGVVLAAARGAFGEDNLRIVLERQFPLPDLVAGSKALTRLLADGVIGIKQRGSRMLWRLRVWCCTRG